MQVELDQWRISVLGEASKLRSEPATARIGGSSALRECAVCRHAAERALHGAFQLLAVERDAAHAVSTRILTDLAPCLSKLATRQHAGPQIIEVARIAADRLVGALAVQNDL